MGPLTAPQRELIVGPTGAGKTGALQRRFYELVQQGVPTGQILVLTAGAAHSAFWRRTLKLEAHTGLEVHGYFGFIQKELTLWWAPVQEARPELKRWLQPAFLNVEVAHHLMRKLVDEIAAEFSSLKASLQRVAIQIASNLSTVAAAAGLTPAEIAERMIAAEGPDKAPLYRTVQGILERFRARCLEAGVLDYALALDLYHRVLLEHAPYREHLRRRFRHLLVDDLDESTPAEQDFIAAMAGLMDSVLLTWSPDGGHAGFMGASPDLAITRFAGYQRRTLEGAQTCSPAAFRLAEALVPAVLGVGKRPAERFGGVVEDWFSTELHGAMLDEVFAKVLRLVERGVPPGEIALLTPRVDSALEAGANRALAPKGIPVQNLSLSRRLLDEPTARAVITLAALVHPGWQIPLHTGSLAAAFALLLGLDAIRASVLAEAVAASGALPDLDATGLRRRVGFARAEDYDYLRTWVSEAAERGREWETDEFAQAVVSELLAPLMRSLTPDQLRSCQQLLQSAHRFRLALERFGPGAYGAEYVKMLTEGTVAAEPLEAYQVRPDAVLLATPFAYLTARHSSQYQIWLDVSSAGWYPNDVKELANPHVLSPAWASGERWGDAKETRVRRQNAARTARALLRRCRGRLVLADCAVNAWGQEQEGGLAGALADLVPPLGKSFPA